MMDTDGDLDAGTTRAILNATVPNEATSVTTSTGTGKGQVPDSSMNGEFRTLNGEMAEDEFAAAEVNYEVLIGKIDALLERLRLDA